MDAKDILLCYITFHPFKKCLGTSIAKRLLGKRFSSRPAGLALLSWIHHHTPTPDSIDDLTTSLQSLKVYPTDINFFFKEASHKIDLKL